MSQYTHFFIKTNENKYFPIGTFSRNSNVAQAINDFLPYGDLRVVTKGMCHEAVDSLEEMIHNAEVYKESIKAKIEWLKTAEGDLEERMDMVYELSGELAEADEDTPARKRAIGFFETLIVMIEEAEDDEKYGSEENGFGIAGDSYIYAGIEIGNPNVTYAHDGWGDPIENRVTGYKAEDTNGSE